MQKPNSWKQNPVKRAGKMNQYFKIILLGIDPYYCQLGKHHKNWGEFCNFFIWYVPVPNDVDRN